MRLEKQLPGMMHPVPPTAEKDIKDLDAAFQKVTSDIKEMVIQLQLLTKDLTNLGGILDKQKTTQGKLTDSMKTATSVIRLSNRAFQAASSIYYGYTEILSGFADKQLAVIGLEINAIGIRNNIAQATALANFALEKYGATSETYKNAALGVQYQNIALRDNLRQTQNAVFNYNTAWLSVPLSMAQSGARFLTSAYLIAKLTGILGGASEAATGYTSDMITSTGATDVFAGGIGGLSAASATGIGAIAAIAAALGIFGYEEYTAQQKGVPLQTSIQNITQSVGRGIPVWSQLVNFLATSAAGWVMMGEKAGPAIEGFFTEVVTIFSRIPSVISNAVSQIPSMVSSFFNQLPTLVGEALGFMIGVVVKILITLPGAIESILTQLPGLAEQAFTTFATYAYNAIVNLPNIVSTIVTRLPGIVIGAFSTLISDIPGALYSIINTVQNLLGGLPAEIANIFENLGSIILNAFVKGLQDAASGLGNALSNFFSGVTKGFSAGFKIPGLQTGGVITTSQMLANLHQNEIVLPASAVSMLQTALGANSATDLFSMLTSTTGIMSAFGGGVGGGIPARPTTTATTTNVNLSPNISIPITLTVQGALDYATLQSNITTAVETALTKSIRTFRNVSVGGQ